MRRLFFALWPDEALRQALRRAVDKAVRQSGGKPVPPENYHVTLKFLGNVNDDDCRRLRRAAARIRRERFELHLDTLGFWPRPRILWLGVAQLPAALTALARDLDQLAESCRVRARQAGSYRPHVTLARKVARPDITGAVAPLVWQPESFALVASVTHPKGARYRVLETWPF